MTGVSRFQDLVAWDLAHQLKLLVHQLCERPVIAKDFRFRDQLIDAAASAPRNLAEGFGRFRHADFARFARIAKASELEVLNHLIDACDRGYLTRGELPRYQHAVLKAVKTVNGLIRYLESSPDVDSSTYPRPSTQGPPRTRGTPSTKAPHARHAPNAPPPPHAPQSPYNFPVYDYLTGVYNITPTPFQPDGQLDVPSLRNLTSFTKARGVSGMTILGVLGEADKLTEAERDRVITETIAEAGPELPVCVGTTHAGTDGCIVFSRRAQELGARAVMVAPPKLARTNDAALQRHYVAVAEAVDIPVVVQDFPPAVGGITMSVELIAALGDASERLRFLKLEDEPSPMKVSQVRAANPNVKIFGGLGGMMFLEELRHGAIGTMTGFAFPEILVDIYSRYTSGDLDGATDVFYRYMPLIRFENQPRINLALRKHIYHRRGAIASPRVRAPFTPVDADTLVDLDDLLRRLALLPVEATVR
jgi:4-hydroxy-tetrahydrodipicolinate synthase